MYTAHNGYTKPFGFVLVMFHGRILPRFCPTETIFLNFEFLLEYEGKIWIPEEQEKDVAHQVYSCYGMGGRLVAVRTKR